MTAPALTTMVLTHPLHVLLAGVIVLRGVQGVIAVGREAWRVRRLRSDSQSTPAAGRSGLRAA
jgi:hypothetical protein